ncbi:THAP domain-containing protein 1-like [Ostrea edulis]|uniref:THAP domain-containing protein 1-like n=1 Tax=Ostrea edulis TaxID=37623 RepID=UPI0024AF1578|nr:THAP domain-containing protein 1-like [Ostrea edulis]
MVVSCCVIGCANRFDKSSPKSFYRIPKKPESRRELWISAIKRQHISGKPWEPADHDRVCYLHFVTGSKSNDLSSPDYVPSVNMGYDTIRQKNPDLRKARYLRAEKRETERQHIEVASALLDLSCKENLNMPVSDPDLPSDCPSNASQHDNCLKKIAELRLENKQLYCELERLQVENKALKEQRPGHLTTRAQTWSNYKHSNTIKFLVSITPTGAISYVSRAFGGRTSDKVITLRSGYLDKLQYGDQVMADRGFLIAEELANHGATLVIPAFTRGKTQLSARDVEQTRKIAHVRIHVERAIERIKNFNILSTNLSMHMVPHADSILTICAAVCNLQPKLVA